MYDILPLFIVISLSVVFFVALYRCQLLYIPLFELCFIDQSNIVDLVKQKVVNNITHV